MRCGGVCGPSFQLRHRRVGVDRAVARHLPMHLDRGAAAGRGAAATARLGREADLGRVAADARHARSLDAPQPGRVARAGAAAGKTGLQGGGRAVTLEGLTQAERNLLYEVRAFARYRQDFVAKTMLGGSSGASANLAIGGGGGGSFAPAKDEKAKIGFSRNQVLIDLRQIPGDIRDKIINTYDETKPAKGKILDYFIANKLKNLMEVIEEF